MDIRPYLSYFHDGSILLVEQEGDYLTLNMESSQVSPSEVPDLSLLSNFGTLRGRLHLYGVRMMSDESSGEHDISKIIEGSEIMDFEFDNGEMTLSVIWNELINGRSTEQWRSYRLQFDSFDWENLPELKFPKSPSIHDYQQYFVNGVLRGIHVDVAESLVEIYAESGLIESHHSPQAAFKQTSRHTLLGTLVFRWIVEARRDGSLVPLQSAFKGILGKIDRLSISQHVVVLEIKWHGGESQQGDISNHDVLEFVVGAIWWRPEHRLEKMFSEG